MAECLPILYSFRRCPYAMRARMALVVADLQVELREVVLRDKPRAMLTLSPKGTVPVLQLPDGTVLEESLDIMLWAMQQRDSQHWWPDDGELRSQQLQLIERNDEEFKGALDRYKYPDRYAKVDALEQRAIGVQFLMELEQRLQRQRFLFSATAVLADVALFPFVRQFANTDNDWFVVQDWPNLLAWLQYWLESEWFARTMAKYAPWVEGAKPAIFPLQ